MSSKVPVVLSEIDLDVLALMETTERQYQVYLETVSAQARLKTPQQRVVQRYTWDHPLHLVIGKDDYALVERTPAGSGEPEG